MYKYILLNLFLRTKVYYGLLREPDVTAFVDTMEDEEEEPQPLNTSTSGNNNSPNLFAIN